MSTIVRNKGTNDLLRGFLAAGIILLLILIGLLLKQGFDTPIFQSEQPIPSPTPILVEKQELFLGERKAQSTEEIIFKASPESPTDSIWLIRLEFENASTIEIIPFKGILLPACENMKTVIQDEVCADLAWDGPFNAGEEVFKIRVTWLDEGRIFRLNSDGYYNGEELSLNNLVYLPRVAGLDSSTQITFSTSSMILLAVGSVLIFAAGIGIYLVLKDKKNLQGSDRISRVIVIAGMGLLATGSVVAAALFTSEDTTPTQTPALSPETEFVYVYLSPTALPPAAVTQTPEVMITDTPLPTTYPEFVVIYVTLSPAPAVEVSSSPSPTPTVPFTDNIYVTCGAIDINGDTKLDHIDQPVFMSTYNRYCVDTPPVVGCGGKDVNADGIINYIDLYYFLDNYYPKTLDCTIY